MTERRNSHRPRCYLGGRITFGKRAEGTECLVRNLTAAGAKLVLAEPALLPDEFDLAIEYRGFASPARMVWRRGGEVGVAFPVRPSAEIVAFDAARRRRDAQSSAR